MIRPRADTQGGPYGKAEKMRRGAPMCAPALRGNAARQGCRALRWVRLRARIVRAPGSSRATGNGRPHGAAPTRSPGPALAFAPRGRLGRRTMCAPMAYNRPFQGPTGGAHPRVASLAPSGQFTFSPSPTASVWDLCRGAPWGSRQDSDRCRWLGNPGAEVEPHRRQFLQTQGPVARREFRGPLRFCAPEMIHNFSGGCPP